MEGRIGEYEMRTIERNGYIFQLCPEHPHRRFKGSKPTAPKPIAPVATPRELDEEVKFKDEARRRQRIAAAGRGGTILNQGQSLSSGANASILGKSTA